MPFCGRKVWRLLAQPTVRLGDGAGAFVYIPHLSADTRCLAYYGPSTFIFKPSLSFLNPLQRLTAAETNGSPQNALPAASAAAWLQHILGVDALRHLSH